MGRAQKNVAGTSVKVQRDSLLVAIRDVAPGLGKDAALLEQCDHVVFMDGAAWTYNQYLCASAAVPGLPKDWHAAVPAKPLEAFLSKAPGETIAIEAKPEKWHLQAGKAKATLTVAHEVLLPLDEVPEPQATQPVPKGLVGAIELCLPTVSRDNRKPVLGCVRVAGFEAVSSDDHRLTIAPFDEEIAGSWLLLAETAKAVCQYDLEWYAVEDNWLHLGAQCGAELSCRLMSGKYPDVYSVVDGFKGVPAELPEELVPALERATVFTEADGHPGKVTCHLKKGTLTVQGEGPYGSYEETVPCPHKGGGVQFICNPSHLAHCLNIDHSVEISDRLMRIAGQGFDHYMALWRS